jgi:hypothetical protein
MATVSSKAANQGAPTSALDKGVKPKKRLVTEGTDMVEGVTTSLVPPTMQLNQQRKQMTQKLQFRDNLPSKAIQ